LPCTSPISDAPRRRAGTACRFQFHRREACSTLTLRCAPRVDPRGLDRHRAAPCGTTRATIGTPSIVSRLVGLPRPPKLRAPSCLNALRTPAHRFHPGVAASCVSTWCGVPLGQRRAADSPCGSSFVATRDASDRLLPSHVYVRAPAPRRFPGSSTAFAPAPRRYRLPHVSAIRFGGPHVLPWIHHGGLVVPVVMRANRTSDAPVASPSRVIPLARGAHPEEPPRPPSTLPRERGGCSDDPGHLPSDELLCPATPSRAPGSGLPGSAAWPPRFSGCRHLFTSLWILADTTDGQAPVHVPRCQRESRFSGPRHRSPTSATCFCDARAHPTSLRSSHASGAFAPLLAGTNRCRLRWPPRCVAAPGACEPRPVRADLRATRSACADETSRGPKRSSKGEPRALGRDCACPSRGASGTRVTGSTRRGGWRASAPRRTGRDLPRMPPREGRHRRRDRGAFHRTGTLTRAEDCSSVRAWTAAPSRRLRRGIARGHARLFDRFCGASL